MARENKKVEVKDPAVKEMGKKKSCLRRGCSRGCFFIIFLFISFLVIIKFTSSPSVEKVEEVPKDFPQNVPVYDEEKINTITISSENNSLLAKSAKILPKFIIVSTHVTLGENSPQELEEYLKVPENIKNKDTLKRFVYLMKTPTKKQKSRIEIKWSNLSADPDFISNFYETTLENNEYSTDTLVSTKEIKRISFTKKNIIGSIYIEDNPNNTGTDSMILTVIISPND